MARPSPRRLAAGIVVSCAAAALPLLVACGGGDAKPAGTTPPAAKASQTAGVTTPLPTTKTGEAVTATPAGPARVADEPVAFATEDGVTLRGHLYSVPGPIRKVVVFSHMFPNDQRAWTAFAQEAAAGGSAALTYDFRGYGESGGARDASKTEQDLSAALRFIKSRDYTQVYLVGASMGGTAALKVASKQDVAGVIAVSAPDSFMGVDVRRDVANIRAPKLFVASKGDDDAPAAVTFFMQTAPEPKQSQLYDGSAHGTELLQGANAASFKKIVLDFVAR